ncbi:MAG: polyprenyl synthetase family protein [bacterium]|nr:polyprenyl synthetase family protein [bacterium]
MDLRVKHWEALSFIEQKLRESLNGVSDKLHESMSYSLLGDGKRIRPWMVLTSSKIAAPHLSQQQAWELASLAAVAVEYIHTYSLIHDDLPAMDNDDMRRGKLTSHRQFDEATAILTGDAFLTNAFAYLGATSNNAAEQCVLLAKSVGSEGMILGQLEDIQVHKNTNETAILKVYGLKTGKLFAAAARLGALSVDASLEVQNCLSNFGYFYGIAFQLADDLIDKNEAVEFFGEDKVKILLQEYINKSIAELDCFGSQAEDLVELSSRLLIASSY